MSPKKIEKTYFFIIFASADRIDLQTVRKGIPKAFPLLFYVSENILNRNKMKELNYNELPQVNSQRWLSLENLEGEVWMPLFDGNAYQISNYGRLKSIGRYVKQGERNVFNKELIMRPCANKKGYLFHNIRPFGKSMTISLHKLVWKAFNGEIPRGYEINHIDENKFNNTIRNLNILTHKENVNWGTHNARMAKTLSKTHRLARKVEQIKDGKVVATFCSIAECERQTGIDHRAISACCLGKRNTHKGYEWRFVE